MSAFRSIKVVVGLAVAVLLGILLDAPLPADTATQGAPARPKTQPRGSSRDKAVAWLRANNAFGPRHKMVDTLAQALEQEVDGGKAFFLSLGTRLVKSRQPTLLVGRNGAFQAYELPLAQAGKWIGPLLTELKTTAPLDEVVKPVPLVLLDELNFAGAANLDGSRKLTGTVAYQKAGTCDGEVALRFTFMVGALTRARYYPLADGLAGDKGTLSFSFPPVQDAGNKQYGPLPVFVELCAFAHPDRRGKVVVLSNSVPALLNVVAGARGEEASRAP